MDELRVIIESNWPVPNENDLRTQGTLMSYHSREVQAILPIIESYATKARIEENQRRLDMIEAFKNRELKPGELTAANFGSAGAGIVESAYEQSFKDRILELKKENQ